MKEVNHLKTVREPLNIKTTLDLINDSAENHPNIIAMEVREETGWKSIDYKTLLHHIKATATYLKRMGIKKGDKVGIISSNKPEWGIAYLSIHWAGGIAVPIDAKMTYSEINHIIKNAEVKVAFSSRNKFDDVKQVGNDSPNFIECVPIETLTSLRNHIPESGPADVREDDIATLLYTSGTTGSSKGVVLTHKNLCSNVNGLYQTIDFGESTKFYHILPLHHIFASTVGLLGALSAGSTIIFATSLKSSHIKEDMKEKKPEIMLVVPLILEKYVKAINREISHLSIGKKGAFVVLKGLANLFNLFRKGTGASIFFKSLREEIGFDKMRFLVSGGASLPPWISSYLERWGFPIIQGYGLSETSPVLSTVPPYKPKNTSVGFALPGIKIKIYNPGEDGIGEIIAKGDNVMQGYYKNEDATRKVFTEDGWFLTGDMGYIDNAGYLHITGRRKSVMVTKGGKNIYPEEIEERLLSSPLISEVLVTMKKNPKTEQDEVVAIIFPDYTAIDEYFTDKGVENPNEDAVYKLVSEEVKRINKEITKFKRVRRVILREEEFPKTTTQKIKRYLFEEMGVEINGNGKPRLIKKKGSGIDN